MSKGHDRSSRQNPNQVRPRALLLCALFAALCCVALRFVTNGILIWVLLTAAVFFSWHLCEITLHFVGPDRFHAKFSRKLMLSAISLMLSLTVLEILLETQAASITYDPNHPPDGLLLPPLTLPNAWERRKIDMGANKAYYWHGHLHVHDLNAMRRTEEFPEKPPGVFRVLVVGDSLTYGFGVPAEEAYPAVIEQLLGKEYSVEVFNLGIAGLQSADVRYVVEDVLRHVKARGKTPYDPDLFVYGVCLNDFLPAGDVTEVRLRYPFPLPEAFKEWFEAKTRVGAFFGERYVDLMRQLDLHEDFTDQILVDFDERKRRFGADAKAMNDSVVASGLPPMIAMVLQQYPTVGSREHEMTRVAESLLTDASMTVIPTQQFLETYNGRQMRVSRFEGHPNSTAHALFATQFAEALKELPELSRYRKPIRHN